MKAASSLDRLSLEQLFDCGKFGRSRVAENECGDLVSIYDVPRGLACNCLCPSCRRAMVARTKDDIKAAHFAHYGTSDTTCTSAGETALHMFAKQVANERRAIALPELIEEVDYERELVVPAQRLTFDEATLEKRTGPIVPDVVLSSGGRRLIVEFKVTHECGPEKIARIVDLDIGAIEVDLSSYRGMPLKDLKDGILFKAPRKWLHNPNSKAARARAAARAHLRRAWVAEEVARLETEYRHPSSRTQPGSGDNANLARADGLGSLIGIEANGAGCFLVDLAEWQASILLFLLNGTRGVLPDDILAHLQGEGWVAPWALNLPPDVEVGLRARVQNYLPPVEAIAFYLEELVNQRTMVRHWDGRFQASRYLRSIVGATKDARQKTAMRFEEARGIVERLMRPLPIQERSGFDFDEWAGVPVGRSSVALRDAVKGDNSSWSEFLGQLHVLESNLRANPRGHLDLLGLPLARERFRFTGDEDAVRIERLEDQRRMHSQASEARVTALRQYAVDGLGAGAATWLNTPDARLHGLTPTGAAQFGEAEFQTAREILQSRLFARP